MKHLRIIAKLLAPWRTIRRLEREVERLRKILENPFLFIVKITERTP